MREIDGMMELILDESSFHLFPSSCSLSLFIYNPKSAATRQMGIVCFVLFVICIRLRIYLFMYLFIYFVIYLFI